MIYYVEDDINVRELSIYALKHAGFEVRGFCEGYEFLDACKEELPDLILLDVMLPQINGIELLKILREHEKTRDIPIMMLSAKGSEYDKVLGLDSGADDYLAKPYGMVELVSRCKALLRRSPLSSQAMTANKSNPDLHDTLTCGCISLSKSKHEVTCDSKVVELTLKEFELLAKLMSEPARALSRPQLLEDVWQITFSGETRTVDTHIQTLRRKLNNACNGAGDMIQTVRGVGYRINGNK